MAFETEDALHEGYLLPQFEDGLPSYRVRDGAMTPPGSIAIGPGQQDLDDNWAHRTRSAGEVTGWVLCCSCSGGTLPPTWVGPVFTRVPSKTLENLAAFRIFAPDEEVAHVSERKDVSDFTRDLWLNGHALSMETLAQVATAADAALQARSRLDETVALAREGGASWADIGHATGMTRQSAHTRWGKPGPERRSEISRGRSQLGEVIGDLVALPLDVPAAAQIRARLSQADLAQAKAIDRAARTAERRDRGEDSSD